MIICSVLLHLELLDVQSLKGRRAIVNRIREKLKTFNVSLLDISSEYPKEADIAFVFLSPNTLTAAQYREKIEHFLEKNFPELNIDMEYEEF
jgi:uncharacterized protein YlxP (DUF503 family)